MTRLESTFTALSARGEQALVAYLTVGDPDLETSYQAIATLCRAGVDVLELGVPFSDPSADGPVIQRAATRSLAAGTTLLGVLEVVRRVRAEFETPIVLFGYYNPFLQYGMERLATEAAAAGVDGFLTVDLPPEEAGEFHAACAAESLDMIYLLTPTSTASRIEAVKRVAGGFVYYVSRTGVTGAGALDAASVNAQVARIKSQIPLPVCVGFGVSTAQHVASLRSEADGVVVGSAIVALIEKLGRGEAAMPEIESLVRELKAATRTAMLV